MKKYYIWGGCKLFALESKRLQHTVGWADPSQLNVIMCTDSSLSSLLAWFKVFMLGFSETSIEKMNGKFLLWNLNPVKMLNSWVLLGFIDGL